MKRNYFLTGSSGREILIVEFEDKSLESLSEFLIFESSKFGQLILENLNSLLEGIIENYSFSGNLLDADCHVDQVVITHLFDDDLPASKISTREFYDLIIEYNEFNLRTKQGILELPIDIS
ncbi:hypothetical protein [Streptococcus ruminantium]|uniref:hypothetical protein n=1 Tax=Streptococcus ruminantium TaxID=1917441 RepID=UPI0012DC74BE|nr:hypothetical protein [Streptococcus ruminantium]